MSCELSNTIKNAKQSTLNKIVVAEFVEQKFGLIEKIVINGRAVGYFVATPTKRDGFYVIGWSLCNSKDPFDKTKGLAIALNRWYHYYNTDEITNCKIPLKIRKNTKAFIMRCNRYFKARVVLQSLEYNFTKVNIAEAVSEMLEEHCSCNCH